MSKNTKKTHDAENEILSNRSLSLDFLDKLPVEGRVWPKLEQIDSFLGSGQPEGARQELGFYVLKFYQSLFNKSTTQREWALQQIALNATQAKPYPLFLVEAHWLAIFSSEIPSSSLLKLSLSEIPLHPWLLRYRAFLQIKEGMYTDAGVTLQSIAPEFREDVDQELLQGIQSKRLPILGAGFLFPYEEVGSFHFPASELPESDSLNLYILDKLAEAYPVEGSIFLELGVAYFFHHQLQNSEETLLNLLTKHPDQVDALALLGFLEEKKGNFTEAARRAKNALEVSPLHPFALVNLARFYLESGSSVCAQKYLEKALEVAPEYPEALSLYGRYLASKVGKEDLATSYLKKAIQLEPKNPNYHLRLCISLLQMGEIEKLHTEWAYHKSFIPAYTETDSARRLLSHVLMGAKEPLQEVALAELLLQNGFQRAGKFFLEKAWRRHYKVAKEKQAEFYYHTGIQANRANLPEISLGAFEQLKIIEGTSGAADVFEAIALQRQGNYEQALEKIEKYPQRDQHYYSVKHDIQWGLLQLENCLESAQMALQKDPQYFLTFFKGFHVACYHGTQQSAQKFCTSYHGLDHRTDVKLYCESLIEIQFGSPRKVVNQLQAHKVDGKWQWNKDAHGHSHGMEEEFLLPAFALVLALYKESEYDLLLTFLDEVSEAYPEFDSLWIPYRAECYRRQGSVDKALALVTEEFEHPFALVTRALCLEQKQNSSALEETKKKILSFPDWAKPVAHPEGLPRVIAQKWVESSVLV